MSSVKTTAKRGGLLSSGRGRRWLLLLLSSLLSAPARRMGALHLAGRTAPARRSVRPHSVLPHGGPPACRPPRLTSRQRWRAPDGADSHGTRHQPRMGAAGLCARAGAPPARRHPRAAPPGRPVPRRLEPRLHHRSGRALTGPPQPWRRTRCTAPQAPASSLEHGPQATARPVACQRDRGRLIPFSQARQAARARPGRVDPPPPGRAGTGRNRRGPPPISDLDALAKFASMAAPMRAVRTALPELIMRVDDAPAAPAVPHAGSCRLARDNLPAARAARRCSPNAPGPRAVRARAAAARPRLRARAGRRPPAPRRAAMELHSAPRSRWPALRKSCTRPPGSSSRVRGRPAAMPSHAAGQAGIGAHRLQTSVIGCTVAAWPSCRRW